MWPILGRLCPGHARRLSILLLACATSLAGVQSAHALTQFVNANGGISMGVAPLGPPISPGVPTYLLNNVNGRTDILTNPGLGLTANPSIPNNTLSVGPLAWGPGQYIFGFQNGGGNINGPFGNGAAYITGPQFGYTLADGGVPGGVRCAFDLICVGADIS